MMISAALALAKGISRAVPVKTWIMIGGAIAAVAAVLWFGHSRYQAGVADTDAKWQAASERLAEQARRSADAATRREAPRIAAHAARVAAEKEKIDAAIAEGSSPLDALFPAG